MTLFNVLVLLLFYYSPPFFIHFCSISIEVLYTKESTILGYINKMLFYTETICRVNPLGEHELCCQWLWSKSELVISAESSVPNTTHIIQLTFWTLEVERCLYVILVLADVHPTAAVNTTPVNSKFIYCILILLKFLFDSRKHTLLSYKVANLLNVLFMKEVHSLSFIFLFHSRVHA